MRLHHQVAEHVVDHGKRHLPVFAGGWIVVEFPGFVVIILWIFREYGALE